MKNKKIIVTLTFTIILAVLAVIFIYNKNKVTIEKFDLKAGVVKTIEIEDKKKINELKEIVKDIHPLDSEEYVDLGIAIEYIINVNGFKISFNFREDEYCIYNNQKLGFGYNDLAKMPEGLLEWAKEILKENNIL